MNSSINFEELAKSVLTEHNRIRQDPHSYIPLLKDHIKYFKGNLLSVPGKYAIETNEGVKAYEEAISFLKNQKPLDALTYDERLSKAAEDHVKDLGPKGLLSHESSEGKTMTDRIELYCEWETSSGESIDLGSKTSQDVIISLLVDDGVKTRGHRLNLFKPDFKYIGICSGPHRDYEVITVLDYVGGIREMRTPFFDYSKFKYEYPQDISSVSKYKKEIKKPKVGLQVGDEDAPERAVSVKIVKSSKTYNGKTITLTKKYYTLDDGTPHIVEVEEF